MLSGLLILIGAVAMTKFRRVYEAAIFKTLGATRRLIAAVLVIEYGLLGMLAGGIGAGGAIALTWAISKYALEIPFKPLDWYRARWRRRHRRSCGGDRRDRRAGKFSSENPWPRFAR